jgi:hypothetical protein
MPTTADVVTAVGPALFTVVVEGSGVDVGDVFLAEPDEPDTGQPGDLVLGVGLSSPDQAVGLLERCAGSDASGLVLRSSLAAQESPVAAATRHRLCLVGLQAGVPWAHVVWLLRGVLDRAALPGSPVAGDAAVHNDLFALADTAAAIIDAPVTIEDNRSRVLAYSSQLDRADTARVSTIVGRRVPPEVVAHFRSQGVFRRLARSSEPFLVPGRPDGTLPRLVVPVRAADEWLGSIWAVVDGPVPDEKVAELSQAASVLALHLLRVRAQADVARRLSTDRLRTALRHYSPDLAGELTLPDGPWRVVALASGETDPQRQLEFWESTLRQRAWADPLLADLDGEILAVVTEAGPAGSWPWLRPLVGAAHREDDQVGAAAGGLARTPAELPRSRAEAVEVLGLVRRGALAGPAEEIGEAWDAVTVHRAAGALDMASLSCPLPALIAHDSEHATDYVATLTAVLEHYGEPIRAARLLHVHPNTLRYRTRRISELAGIDLTSPRVRLALQLQILAAGRPTRTPQL